MDVLLAIDKCVFLMTTVGLISGLNGCANRTNQEAPLEKTASELLGNPQYPAICYGGYRHTSREIQPTLQELKEDMRILHALGFRIVRTYNVHYDEAANLLKVIRELRQDDPGFEMYVMLGIWIDCLHAWSDQTPDHTRESEANTGEVDRAVALIKEYPEIVKILSVGNEAMVKWATSYYVEPFVILKWVRYLQDLKKEGTLPKTLWITSSDNFASWGGGGAEYHTAELKELVAAVDYISMHTYPMHDTHYNPDFWGVTEEEQSLSDSQQISAAMLRARDYAIGQYQQVCTYVKSLGLNKPVHIGETGWSSHASELYGPDGSRACDEYKAALYYELIMDWAKNEGISCFYFEAFDEAWKDAANPGGSENHFGLINLRSEAKLAIWEAIDNGLFTGLMRDGKSIQKTYNGDTLQLMKEVLLPRMMSTSQHIFSE